MAPQLVTKTRKISHPIISRKSMLTLFWDEKGVILEHWMDKGATVTSVMYGDLLKNQLGPANRSKRRGLLTSGVFLLHDNARPHTARSTVSTIQDMSVLHTHPIHQISPPVIFTLSDHSKRRYEEAFPI